MDNMDMDGNVYGHHQGSGTIEITSLLDGILSNTESELNYVFKDPFDNEIKYQEQPSIVLESCNTGSEEETSETTLTDISQNPNVITFSILDDENKSKLQTFEVEPNYYNNNTGDDTTLFRELSSLLEPPSAYPETISQPLSVAASDITVPSPGSPRRNRSPSNFGPSRPRSSKKRQNYRVKPKLYEREEPFSDPEDEKRRRNAIKAHRNRVKKNGSLQEMKDLANKLQSEIDQLRTEKDAILKEKDDMQAQNTALLTENQSLKNKLNAFDLRDADINIGNNVTNVAVDDALSQIEKLQSTISRMRTRSRVQC